MRLLGSETSPYVRRVRIVALELGVPHVLVPVDTAAGEAELHRVTPLRKVPTAVLPDGRVVWDSHAIVDLLLAEHGPGPFPVREGADRWTERNVVNAVEGALEAAVHVLYLEQDGVPASAAAFLLDEVARTASALTWVGAQLRGGSFFTGVAAGFGRAELVLLTALGWLRLRNRYPVDRHPGLVAFEAAHAARPSVVQTQPPARAPGAG
jgi:glutathione S-transferase